MGESCCNIIVEDVTPSPRPRKPIYLLLCCNRKHKTLLDFWRMAHVLHESVWVLWVPYADVMFVTVPHKWKVASPLKTKRLIKFFSSSKYGMLSQKDSLTTLSFGLKLEAAEGYKVLILYVYVQFSKPMVVVWHVLSCILQLASVDYA